MNRASKGFLAALTGSLLVAAGAVTVSSTASAQPSDPTVTIELPADGQIVDFGDAVPFEVTVTDPGADEIDCSNVTVAFILGHDSHGHHLTSETGCSGTLQVPAEIGHDGNANIFGVWDAEYTSADGVTVNDQHVTPPSLRQAEHFGTEQGVEIISRSNAHGAMTVGRIHNGDWIAFEPYVLADATEFTARVSSGGAGGTIEVRAGSPTGDLLGSVDVPKTGSWNTFQDVATTLSGAPAGTTTLHLVFTGPTGNGALFAVDDFTFTTGDPAAADPHE
jgi:carbohydrate binding protein with CBM6 domain